MAYMNRSKPQLLEEIQRLYAELAAIKLIIEKRTTELYISEERFSLAMRGANDGLWDWNLETNEVYYSPRWKSMLGYAENELGNNLDTWANLVHPDDKNRVLEKVQDYIAGRADSYEVEMRIRHKDGHEIYVLSRAFLVTHGSDNKPVRLVGTHIDITERKNTELSDNKNTEILEMIAIGQPAADIYDAIALMYEARHPGMRCSMLELEGNKLLHGGAPSLPKEYCDAVNGLEYGPNVGSCGTSTYTGKRVLVENIETDPKWKEIKHLALPHGMRCCWSEPISNSSGKILGAFGMYYNHPALPNEKELKDLKAGARLAGIVMERDQAQKRIRILAYTDELTGLPSRASFSQRIEEITKTSTRHNHCFALLYIDLDDFKSINDSMGHDAGDLLLKTIAKRLIHTCHEVDFIARIGGDEFCILVEEIEDSYATNIAKRCLHAIAQPIEIYSRKLTPSCSIGIAYFPDDGKDFSSLLKASDTSLYKAKENGKNQYAFYKTELTQKAQYRFQIEQNLREAIEKQQLSLVYQPQIEISTGNIFGFEALSRWRHPELGQIPPINFIATAEKIGMIKPLTEWVLRTACRQLVAWKKEGVRTLRMAVNISPILFLDQEFVSVIKRIIEEIGIAPIELELEVTENIVQTDPRNLSIFQDLKDLGVSLAIDDFGTGYSSFASLKHLKVDHLKIDKFFVNDMLIDEQALILISSMIEMGRKLGHQIIAEGVEKPEQLNISRNLGCEKAQGFLFSKPIKANAISKLLLSRQHEKNKINSYKSSKIS
ncbi:PAS domain S-box-containing protein/diguanylate cyclase (GGDEF) domain-containing protein [Nitrosomonas sp. PY1]|uniref:bifunctional diguanylate cyclase/phosphodiesterase n=1 Tax=Nitrosomonas sp. PY1 TaxID=1803906 RepID=UPI001FC88133|nr:EAL domain-containing protein [Nitrosomonas sp. PY1]GKS68932.1 PAS domain S-box-containing protein/diguanylate cyclase (GGDEF) domain-containing protein [Nitrosomonas sp. PY1]